MRDLNGIATVYERRIKTVTLKRSPEHIADPEGKPNADRPDEVYQLLTAIYSHLDDDQEHLVMLVLNVSNDVVGYKVISSGTQSSGHGDAKIIFRNALMLGAAKIILAHNHPSGSLKVSDADIAFTKKVIEAGRTLDLPLVDHIIYTPNAYTSMRAEDCCRFESLT
ncbi:JAB domain-containing protein [Thiohalomonas denitrificans]|uniref:JAB domain-containing protein n=1 Tax=Thiohalomonas denitrificans TaxID=415747 RepID=UPI0026EFD83F|nr:JAB domain-containing protein [Thiohalomonas denitrificans]